MLTRAENELITRVAGDAPAGRLMKRYWLPACSSDEVVERGGKPVRVRLVGEPCVAGRDAAGVLTLCAADGEPRRYPVREGGGLVWTYLGPPEYLPQFPSFAWTKLSRTHLALVKFIENTNYLQAAEGAIDTAHSWFLHRGISRDWKLRSALSMDLAPRLEAEDTVYGFRYAAIRRPNVDPDKYRYVRVTNVVFPTTVLVPQPMDPKVNPIVQMFIPMDDTHTMHYSLFFSHDGEPVDEPFIHADTHCVPGVDIDAAGNLDLNEANWWKQDRAAMKRDSYTGIFGFPRQDVACQESMGAIVDCSLEHLGTSDVAIIRMRRRMLENIGRLQNGEIPIGLDAHIDYDHLRSEQRLIGIDEPWQRVGAFAGEYSALAPSRALR